MKTFLYLRTCLSPLCLCLSLPLPPVLFFFLPPLLCSPPPHYVPSFSPFHPTVPLAACSFLPLSPFSPPNLPASPPLPPAQPLPLTLPIRPYLAVRYLLRRMPDQQGRFASSGPLHRLRLQRRGRSSHDKIHGYRVRGTLQTMSVCNVSTTLYLPIFLWKSASPSL